MSQPVLYALGAVALVVIGLHGFLSRADSAVRWVLAFNVIGSGTMLLFGAFAARVDGPPDPVPHALVITGIVVAFSASALALYLIRQIHRLSGRATLADDDARTES